jgi:hypothetical protein
VEAGDETLSDRLFTGRVSDTQVGFDDLRIPFIFVPRGAPMPREWMAAHPGWVKIPATFVPRRTQGAGEFRVDIAEEARPSTALPVTPVASLAAGPGLGAADPAVSLGQLIGVGRAALAMPLAAAGDLLFWPTPANPPNESALLNRWLKEHDGKGLHGGLVPPPPTPPLPGLEPPTLSRTKPGEGGFTPPPPARPLPGFTPAQLQAPVLPGRAIEVQRPTVF